MERRHALKALAALGIGNAIFQRALAAEVIQETKLTSEALRNAEWVSGIQLSEKDRGRLVETFEDLRSQLGRLRAHLIQPGVPPAIHFAVGQPSRVESPNNEIALSKPEPPERPKNDTQLAFLSVSELSALIQTRQLTSLEITQCYLRRLKAHGDKLKCIVTLTEDTALKQAKHADEEIAAGRYRGPLHGVPWGAKDLIAYPGYPTTWGAPQYKDRILIDKATVAQRLDDAGAVLVAKLSLGALAMGDQWYGGMTRNPWISIKDRVVLPQAQLPPSSLAWLALLWAVKR